MVKNSKLILQCAKNYYYYYFCWVVVFQQLLIQQDNISVEHRTARLTWRVIGFGCFDISPNYSFDTWEHMDACEQHGHGSIFI